MNKALAALLIVAIPVVLFWSFGRQYPLPLVPSANEDRSLVLFADQVALRVEVASTFKERQRGLAGKQGLDETEGGLLLVFDTADYHGIWMKDMLFPIDILWIDEQFRIAHIEPNVHPDSYPTIFKPASPARFVIETKANFAESLKIEVGDSVTLPGSAIPTGLQ